MVATTRNVANQVFGEVKIDLFTISPEEWAEIVRRAAFNLPMQYMRGFGSITGSIIRHLTEFDIHEAARTLGKNYSIEYCEGVDEKTHLLFCGYLTHEFSSPKVVRDTLLAINRKEEFYVVESIWNVRKNYDDSFTNEQMFVLKRLKFTPANLVEVCKLPPLKEELPALNALIAFEESLWNTTRELDRQLDLARGQRQDAMNQLRRLGHITMHRL